MMMPNKLMNAAEFRELMVMINAIASGEMNSATHHVWHNVNGKAEKLPFTLTLDVRTECGCGAVKTEYGQLTWRCDDDGMTRMFNTLTQLGAMGIVVPLWRFQDEE